MSVALAFMGRIWTYIMASRLFWKVVTHWSELGDHKQKIELVFKNILAHQKPSSEDVKQLLDTASFLLENEFIDIPGVDEPVLARQLADIKNKLQTKLPEVKP